MLNKYFSSSKVLITGHTGFKGSWLSLWLSSLGAKVYGYSVDVPTMPSHFSELDFGEQIVDHRGDISHFSYLNQFISDIKPDFIFHLAAQPLVKESYRDPRYTWLTNVMGSVNLLDSINSLKHSCSCIFITSDKVYDNKEWIWGYRESDQIGGADPYSASKGSAELAIQSYVRSILSPSGGIRVATARAGNVIGGGDWALDRIVPDCIRSWESGVPVEIRNPAATRPWQHVLEPLSGYLQLAAELHQDGGLHGQAFNFGPSSGQNKPVKDIVNKFTNSLAGFSWADISENYGGPHESGLLNLNCDKALNLLKWESVWNFDTTVDETASWYRNYRNKDVDILSFSLQQISKYISDAKERNVKWAL
ncbi:CDP-glucose 4,6-dehydratase [Polynucleobacter paludilacus]|uniref:CDP-glucose 4,6-dehydratase n=1 Tax=Polynucleobacter paludilacus TaxID=1855895 RepID=UPI001BFD638D|nr:CDP-glucose 4,6-dehydratase [Polynucleobacter paludilacus]QWD87320.1 CDP-glucose 4,6-dehydratase [Polynucleobacter paludilacus]